MVGLGVGERSAHISEEFALEKCLRHGSHVNGHHRLGGSFRQPMYLAGEKFFAGAVLSCYKNVGVGTRHFLRYGLKLEHCGRRAPQHTRRSGGGCASIAACGRLAPVAVGVVKHLKEAFVLEWFCYEIRGAALHSFHGEAHVGVGSEQYDMCLRTYPHGLAEPIEAFVACVYAGTEIHVEQKHVGTILPQRGGQHVGAAYRAHLLEIIAHQQFHGGEHAAVVVANKESPFFPHCSFSNSSRAS